MLEIKNVSLTFGAGTINEHKAIDNLSLTVNDSDFITIIGSNGAGKSTLFNIIGGTYITDSGEVILDGEDITLVDEHIRSRYIGRLFQDPMKGSAPGMSIEENLYLAAGSGGWFSRIKKSDIELFKEKVRELNMGLEDRMNSPVGLLSGGQRQALTLLMATINPPKLLLLDEHTAALDPATGDKVIELTQKIVKENNITCMMITHNMQSALDMGNRTIMMNKGNIIVDVYGDEREGLNVSDLLDKFREVSGGNITNDRMLLS